MKTDGSRRLFIKKACVVFAGLTVIPSLVYFRAFSAGTQKDLSSNIDLRTEGSGQKHIIISDKLYDKSGAIIPNGAVLDIWVYSQKSIFQQRAKLVADVNREYQFIADYPHREGGKVPKVNFKVSHDGNSYVTNLKFNKYGAFVSDKHWEQNRNLEDKLFPEMKVGSNQTHLQFNLVI